MSDLHALDRVMQAHTPAIMVPRHTAIEALQKPGHRYLVAQDGLWLEVKRRWLYATVRIAEAEIPLPFGAMAPSMLFTLRQQDLDAVQARFLADARAALPNECAAWGVYDSITGGLEYHPLEPIEAGPGAITFHRPTLGLNMHLAVDLHSHGTLGAFFSETDDLDDAGEVKLSVVVGRVDAEPEFLTRLCLMGKFVEGGR